MRAMSPVACISRAILEHQMVLRIEADQLDLVLQPAAAGGEDVGQHPRIQEEGRPGIEAERALIGRRGDGRGPAAEHVARLVHRDVHARLGQQHGRGQAARPAADDPDAFVHDALFVSATMRNGMLEP